MYGNITLPSSLGSAGGGALGAQGIAIQIYFFKVSCFCFIFLLFILVSDSVSNPKIPS